MTSRQFIPSKPICNKDLVVVDMLNTKGHEDVCYCICDPDKPDLPIVFASQGFCKFTGYEASEIEGRNCRFLQGGETALEDVERIRVCIKEAKEDSINIVNYRKDGTPFINQFFLSPLHNAEGKVCYFIGVQQCVSKKGPGQSPKNVGWVYTQGNHV